MLDVGEAVLTVQRLPQGREPLQDPWVLPIPAATLREGRPVEAEALGDFIGDLLLTQGLISAQLRVALPAAATHWRVLEWPLQDWPDNPIARLRALQPDLGLPFPLEQAYIDLTPLPQAEDQVLFAALQRDLLEDWLQMFSIAGVRLERLVPSQVAVMAALRSYLEAADPGTLVALLLPEFKALRLLVWRDGVPLYERLLATEPVQASQQLEACLVFLRHLHGDAPLELLLADGLPAEPRASLEAALQQLLGQAPAVPSLTGWGNLVVLGLSQLEEGP